MNNAEWVGKWAGRKVSVYEGPYPFVWSFNENEFPWLCEKANELEFVVPDWDVDDDGDWEVVHVGINLKDLVYSKEYVEFGPQHASMRIEEYRKLVEEKINGLVSSNQLLQKLKEGKSLTEKEAETLAEELFNENPHITIDLLRKVYNHHKAQLIQFLKHILGIEILESFPVTVSNSFDKFIAEHNYLNTRQLDFLSLLQSFLIEKGEVEKRDLITAPFTRIHPDGIRGVFSNTEIEEIITFIQKLAA